MSSQNPKGPSARRRIAGERRSARPGGTPDQAESPAPPPSPPRPSGRARRDKPVSPAPARPRVQRVSGDRPGPSPLVLVVLGVLALLLVAVAAFLGLAKWDIRDVREADRVDEATRTAPSSAERAAATILSYNYKSLDADQKAAERYMTPKFRKQYDKSMKLVHSNAPKLRANVDAEVKASGVSHADPDRANVLVYVDQTTHSTANGGEPQVALNRALFSMKRVDGSWLVDNITSY
jgi:Mce-associated membrane protein